MVIIFAYFFHLELGGKDRELAKSVMESQQF
jgi:hypothetical protein